MRRIFQFGLFALAACGDNQDPATADDLFRRIQTANYRATFAKAPGYATKQPSNTAHAKFSDIFVNPTVDGAIKAKKPLKEWPLGSLVVKDGYDGDGAVQLIAVIEKRADGWFWAEYTKPTSADGGAKYSGKPSICINCHQAAADAGNDFTQAIALPK